MLYWFRLSRVKEQDFSGFRITRLYGRHTADSVWLFNRHLLFRKLSKVERLGIAHTISNHTLIQRVRLITALCLHVKTQDQDGFFDLYEDVSVPSLRFTLYFISWSLLLQVLLTAYLCYTTVDPPIKEAISVIVGTLVVRFIVLYRSCHVKSYTE